MEKIMIVTIDGPAGAGKSSVARALAAELGFDFLDTGAMYRSVAWLALQSQVSWDDSDHIVSLVSPMDLVLDGNRVILNGEDVSQAIRDPRVGKVIHHVADNQGVRDQLVQLQRRLAAGKDMVTEGRDQGSVAFPDAECKVFLVASPEERARRRAAQLADQGTIVSWQDVLVQQNDRDERDRCRPVGGLEPAEDAIQFSTDGMSVEQVVESLKTLVRSRISDHP
mgnify:CR=1 FL=1